MREKESSSSCANGVAGATGWGGQGEAPSLASLVNGSSFQDILTKSDSHIAMLNGRIDSALQAKAVAENDLQNEQERAQARVAEEDEPAHPVALIGPQRGGEVLRQRCHRDRLEAGEERFELRQRGRAGRAELVT